MNSSTPLVFSKAAKVPALPGSLVRSWRSNWPILLIATLLPIVLAAIYFRLTYVSGIELNSHTWERRTFEFRRDPFTGVQLTSVQHNAPRRDGLWSWSPNPRAELLPQVIAQHLPQSSVLPPRWDLIYIDNSSMPGGAAEILIAFLDTRDTTGNPFWVSWSQENPSRAAIVWPAAGRLVEFGQYTYLPALFKLAIAENGPDELNSSVAKAVQEAMLEVCQAPDGGWLARQPLLEKGLEEGSAGLTNEPAWARRAAEVGLRYGPHRELEKFSATHE